MPDECEQLRQWRRYTVCKEETSWIELNIWEGDWSEVTGPSEPTVALYLEDVSAKVNYDGDQEGDDRSWMTKNLSRAQMRDLMQALSSAIADAELLANGGFLGDLTEEAAANPNISVVDHRFE